MRNGAIASTHVYAGTSRIVTKVGAGTPVGKVTATIQGTGNITDTGAAIWTSEAKPGPQLRRPYLVAVNGLVVD